MYHAAQHAREWISVEVVRRLFNHAVANPVAGVELWFVPVVNVDGYDYTFQTRSRWRKTLRDNNGDGVIATGDGVDPNRNFSEKWRDIDAQGRNHADLLGVLSHYRAVVWYTATDDFVRDPGQTIGVSKMFDDQMVAVRDYLDEGGKVLVTGQRALQGAWQAYAYEPARARAGTGERCRATAARATRPGRSRTACRSPTTSCSTGSARSRGPRRRPTRPR